MKGLHHSVIEIKDTQHSDIEKILVFLSPGRSKIDVETATHDAREILQKVKIRHKLSAYMPRLKLWRLLSSAFAMFVALLFVIF